jgi:hypothetical protein
MEVHDANSNPVIYGFATALIQADDEYHCSIVPVLTVVLGITAAVIVFSVRFELSI